MAVARGPRTAERGSFSSVLTQNKAHGGENTATVSVNALPEPSGIPRFHGNLLASCFQPLSRKQLQLSRSFVVPLQCMVKVFTGFFTLVYFFPSNAVNLI